MRLAKYIVIIMQSVKWYHTEYILLQFKQFWILLNIVMMIHFIHHMAPKYPRFWKLVQISWRISIWINSLNSGQMSSVFIWLQGGVSITIKLNWMYRSELIARVHWCGHYGSSWLGIICRKVNPTTDFEWSTPFRVKLWWLKRQQSLQSPLRAFSPNYAMK